jgi:hypothetical protein
VTSQTFANRHGDELRVEHHTDTDVPGTVELRLSEDTIYLEPEVVAQLGLALVPVVVGPNDHLVLKLDDSADEADLEQIRDRMAKELPGLHGRLLFVGGQVEAFVVRPGQEVPR